MVTRELLGEALYRLVLSLIIIFFRTYSVQGYGSPIGTEQSCPNVCGTDPQNWTTLSGGMGTQQSELGKFRYLLGEYNSQICNKIHLTTYTSQ